MLLYKLGINPVLYLLTGGHEDVIGQYIFIILDALFVCVAIWICLKEARIKYNESVSNYGSKSEKQKSARQAIRWFALAPLLMMFGVLAPAALLACCLIVAAIAAILLVLTWWLPKMAIEYLIKELKKLPERYGRLKLFFKLLMPEQNKASA